MKSCHLCPAPAAGLSSLRFVGPDKEEWIAVEVQLCVECGARMAKHLKRGIPRWKELKRPA